MPPVAPVDFVSKARGLLAAGQHQEAVKACRIGLLGQPGSIDGRVVLGQALAALGRHDEALAEMHAVLGMDPRNAEALALRTQTEAAVLAASRAAAAPASPAPTPPAPAPVVTARPAAPAMPPARPAPSAATPPARPPRPATEEVDLEADAEEVLDEPIIGVGNETFGGSHATASATALVDDSEPTATAPRRPRAIDAADRAAAAARAAADAAERAAAAAAPAAPPPARSPRISVASLAAEADDVTMSAARKHVPAPSRAKAPSAAPALSATQAQSAAALDDLFSDLETPPPAREVEAAPPPARAPARRSAPPPVAPAAAASAPSLPPLAPSSPRPSGGSRPPPAARAPASAGSPSAASPRSRARAKDDSTGVVLRDAVPSARPRPAAPSAEPKAPSRRPAPRGRRSRLRLALWAAALIVVATAGTAGGLKYRSYRLQQRIDTAIRAANDVSRSDTWIGWRQARDRLAGVVAARDTASTRAALVRARAVIAGEFDDEVEVARAAAEGLGNSLDGVVATAYVALAGDDAGAAQAAAQAVAAAGAPSGVADYLTGRAALMAGQAEAAVASLTAAVAADPRPATLVALAEAQLARGDHAAASEALDRARALSPNHARATLARVHLHIARGDLAKDASGAGALADQLAAELERLRADAARPAAQQQVGVSPRQLADVELAAAALAIARGDAIGARKRLDELNRPSDRRFAEQFVELLLALGQHTKARAEADAGLALWPSSVPLRLAAATSAFHDGDAATVVALLDGVADLAAHPEALTLRGRARLSRGDLGGARADLDAALAVRPSLRDAILGRAAVDLQAGDAAGARTRIAAIGAESTDAEVTVVYAAALRATGEAARARVILQRAIDANEGGARAPLYLELGRALKDGGDLEGARKAYERAIDGDDLAAKREAAQLFLGAGDVALARSTIEAALTTAPADPRLMIDAVRIRAISGDVDGASELLARLPADASGAPEWERQRERGRLALRAGDPAGAAALLAKAVAGEPDLEAFLLLIDAQVLMGALEQATKTQATVLARFPDRPERFVVIGRVHLLGNRIAEAGTAFASARDEFETHKAEARRTALAVLGQAQAVAAGKDPRRAPSLFEEAATLDPTLVEAWIGVADLERDAGDAASALAAYQKASKLAPADPSLWFQIGELAYGMRRSVEATVALEKYLALAPGGDFAEDARTMLAGKGRR